MARGRKNTTAKATELRKHLAESHNDWAALADDIDDDLLPSYHRGDHLYAGRDQHHKHQDVVRS